MAKTSSIEKNKHRIKLVKQYAARRARLKAIAGDLTLNVEERFAARLKLSELPRNSSPWTHSQPVRGHGSAARLHAQDENVAHCVAGNWAPRALIPVLSSRAGRRDGSWRSTIRWAICLRASQCANAAQRQGANAGFAASGACPRCSAI